MIILRKEDLCDQAGMERAFRQYFVDAKRQYDGTFNQMLEAELYECSFADSTVTLCLTPKPWMSNPMEILHGGVAASVLDMTMGLLCRYCSGGYMTPTVGMDVQFLRPGPLDRRLFIRAELTKRGLSVCHATGAMWAEGAEDKLIATSSGVYFVTQRVRTAAGQTIGLTDAQVVGGAKEGEKTT